jgi:hypothetical protein
MPTIRGPHAAGLLLHNFVRNPLGPIRPADRSRGNAQTANAAAYIIDTALMPPSG